MYKAGGPSPLHAHNIMASAATPKGDGFHAPAEWEPHAACLIAWPIRSDVFPFDVKRAQKAYIEVVKAVCRSENVLLCIQKGKFSPESRDQLREEIAEGSVVVVDFEWYYDAWTRDIGPTYVRSSDKREVRGVEWTFNGWGSGTVYKGFARDVCKVQEMKYYVTELICEGGALAFDGEGTVITTESVLLNANRNGKTKTKVEVEATLSQYLGSSKVIWLPEGVYGDNGTFTSGHIDNLVAFVRPAEVILCWADDETDPQFPVAKKAEEILLSSTDAKGRVFKVHHLNQPNPPLYVTNEESAAYTPDILPALEAGTRMPASYVNFYISNGAVIVPQFGQPQTDSAALEKLRELFPTREVIGVVEGRQILLGGGCVHCITQQVPAAPECT